MDYIAYMLQSVVIYLVSTFFALKSSSKKINELKWARKLLKIIMILYLVMWTALLINQTIQVVKSTTENKLFCHSWAYIIQPIFNCIVSIMFICIGLKI